MKTTPVFVSGGLHAEMSGKESSSSSSSSSWTCLCSPTAHPSLFRCSLHRARRKSTPASMSRSSEAKMVTKANLLKAFLMQIINASSHDARRKRNFQPRPSRFSLMNDSGDGVAVS